MVVQQRRQAAVNLGGLDAVESLIRRQEHGRASYLLALLAEWYRASRLRRSIEAQRRTALPVPLPARSSQPYRR